MATKSSFRVCFTVGAVVPWEKAILFGNMIAEPPIVLDYLSKTRGSLLPTAPAEPERDWWDEGPLAERANSYRSILAARHGLTPAALDRLAKGKMPDLLTFRGLSARELKAGAAGRGSRHEFYEIKPRSLSGEIKGTEKVVWLKRAYAASVPYLAGSLYPRHFYPPSGVAELPMVMMDNRHLKDWNKALSIIKKRANLSLAELMLEVRPSPTIDGLLLYRICVKITSNDESDRKDDAVVQTARELVNAFVVCAVAGKPKVLAHEVGDVARALEPALVEGGTSLRETFGVWRPPAVRYPLLDVEMTSGPAVLRPLLPAIRDGMNSRGMALPGDRLMLCCDEAFWHLLIAPTSALHLMHYLRQTPVRWAEYARARPAVGVEHVVQEATEIYDLALVAAESAFRPLVDWAARNPGEAVLVAGAVVVVSALALWALPALAAELAALEAASLAASSSAISTSFIEAAMLSAAVMEEATALELAAAANLSLDAALLSAAETATLAALDAEALAIASTTAVPVGTAAAVLRASAEEALLRQAGSALGRRVISEAVKRRATTVVQGSVGLTVMLASRTAFAAAPGRVRGGPVPPLEAFHDPIGSSVCRMFVLPVSAQLSAFPGGSPMRRPLVTGESFDAAGPRTHSAQSQAPAAVEAYPCRYVGELLVK